MKIRVKRNFKYTFDNIKEHELLPGEYETGRQIGRAVADLAIQFGAAVIVPEPKKEEKKPKTTKKAPENKKLEVKESK